MRWLFRRRPAVPDPQPLVCQRCGEASKETVRVVDEGRTLALCPACHGAAVVGRATEWPRYVAIGVVTVGLFPALVLFVVALVSGPPNFDVASLVRLSMLVARGDLAIHVGWIAFAAALVFAVSFSTENGQRRTEELARHAESGNDDRDIHRDIQIMRMVKAQVVQGMLLTIMASALATYAIANVALGACAQFQWHSRCDDAPTWLGVMGASAVVPWIWLVTEIARSWAAYQARTGPVGVITRAHDAALRQRIAGFRTKSSHPGAMGWLVGLSVALMSPSLVLVVSTDPWWLAGWTIWNVVVVAMVVIVVAVSHQLWGSGLEWMFTAMAVVIVVSAIWLWIDAVGAGLTIGGAAQQVITVVGGVLMTLAWCILVLGLRGRGPAKSMVRFASIGSRRRGSD